MSAINSINLPYDSSLASLPSLAMPKGNPREMQKAKNQKNKKSIKYSRLSYLSSFILEGIRKVSDFANQMFFSSFKQFHNVLLQMNQIIKISGLFDMALIPFILVNISKQVKSLIRGNHNAKIDSAIKLIAEVGLLGRSLTILTMALASIRGISVKVMNWTASAFLATSLLSFATTALTYRTYKKMRSFEHKFVKIGELSDLSEETSLEKFKAALKLMKSKEFDKEFITKAFNCTPENLEIRLLEIEKEATNKMALPRIEDQKVGRQQLNKTLKTLKGHVHHVGNTARIKVVISTIGLIAAVALFASPVASVTYAIGGTSLAANLGLLIHHKVVEYRYSQNLGMHKKWYEWITC